LQTYANDFLPDEAGGGEFAGPLTDWGFQIQDGYEKNQVTSSKALPSIISQSGVTTANATDQEYSDDDFEIEDGTPTENPVHKKKKKRKNNKPNASNSDNYGSESPMLVPINKKSNLPQTQRPMSSSQSFSLPAI
jgi:hypothetical protein